MGLKPFGLPDDINCMGRKKKHEEHENHERWLVSYADFITLLFAFFTSMYAISSVNEGKFRVLSDSLAVAFNPSIFTSGKGRDGASLVKEGRTYSSAEFRAVNPGSYQKLLSALKDIEKDSKLSVLYDGVNVTIRVSEGMLFAAGEDELSEAAYPVLDEISAVLRDMPNNVRVEGHTDNIPVNTERFPSNWDLSSARALRILKYFAGEGGISPRRLSAIGYGEWRPAASNDTPDGREKNRRVDILVLVSEDREGG